MDEPRGSNITVEKRPMQLIRRVLGAVLGSVVKEADLGFNSLRFDSTSSQVTTEDALSRAPSQHTVPRALEPSPQNPPRSKAEVGSLLLLLFSLNNKMDK